MGFAHWDRLQIGVKFIRWLRAELFSTTPWDLALELLEDSYAEK